MTSLSSLTGENCPDVVKSGASPCDHYVSGGFCTLENHFRCLEYIVRHEPPLSYSAISDYTQCHRKFYWHWLQGLELVEKSWAMKLGACASTILGWLHSDKLTDEQAITHYKDYIEELIKQTTDPEDETRQYGHPDVWKMKAMFDAYIEKGYISLKGTTEAEFRWTDPEFPKVHGFIDLVESLTGFNGHFGYEFKYTSNPDNYEMFFMMDQLSSYFIGDSNINRFTVRCFVPPEFRQKQTTKKQVGESMLDFYKRMYEDILSRPLQRYFVSKNYFRNEFDLEVYKITAKRIAEEIIRYIKEGEIDPFYQNKKACLSPFPCDYLIVCKNQIKDPSDMECFKKREVR